MEGTGFRIVHQAPDLIEVAFSRSWNISRRGSIAPLNVEKRYIMQRGTSGFYAYAVVERLKGWPDTVMDQLRIVFKLDKDRFDYMAISEERQRVMPTQEDRDRGKRLAYPEAVLLTNTSNKALEGEVDDKYQYSLEHQDDRVHGWVSTRDRIGFWLVFPSYEFRTGGPTKQELTSHVGPTLLGMFGSTHYAGSDIDTTYRSSEAWKMVYGPVFIYLNSASTGSSPRVLYQDAQLKMKLEESKWPYGFVHSDDFPSWQQRGSVSGRLVIKDPFRYMKTMYGSGAHMGLAPPGAPGSWQRDGKNYQFWNKTNNHGGFSINNVRPGTYSLYGWVPGLLGDYKFHKDVVITPGSHTELGFLVFEPPRNGPTVWEIGVPDRSAAEFFVPEPEPTYINKLYKNLPKDWYRQYGLWERYSKLFPVTDVNFTIGVHDYSKDWYFAQVTR
ncbi:unnamed protein product [Linum tenue]|nr:unnamed protein product [Linum tenue]